MKFMNILQYNGPWKFSIEETPTPDIHPEEVLVRSESVGICGSDVHGFTGESGRRKPGMVMGHEVVGIVEAIGAEVKNLKRGQRVTIFPTLGCGKCAYCKKGWEHICPDKKILGVNAGRWGAMAGYFTCHARQAFPFSEETDPDVGVLAEPIAVATHAVNLMNPESGSTIAIVGGGTIGLALTLVLRNRGFENVYILDKVDAKLALAAEFGAKAIHVEKENAAEVIEKQTGKARVAGIFEAVGSAGTIRTAYDLCDFGGTLVLIGNLAKEFTLPLQGVTSNETTIRGSYGFNRTDFGQAVELVSKNQKNLRKLLSGSCTLQETPKVMEELARGQRQAIKVVIHP
jgi:L-iditol 2-dehydrogenase